ncbi:MAG: hypothetical protein KDC33_03720 [Thermoleophilia bacterium]|nr:hypothetical protein [Thermoleophilia bacterium]
MLRGVGAVLVRAALMVVVVGAVVRLINAASSGGDGANIGAGLGAFAAVIVMAAAWSVRDTVGATRAPVTLGRWAGAGVLCGALMPLLDAALAGGDRAVASDVGEGAVFFALLGVVGAAVGVAIGALAAAGAR